ncbi:MAG: bis(5'-nucleosyl)-tetraphosphatase (symmetrical) YqeK, partial [Candidatus Limivicinus sp.]
DNIPPHKDMEEGSPTAMQRLELCRLNFASLPKTEVSDMEIQRDGKSYSADTLERLQEQFPGAEFSLVIGSDMLMSFEEWYRFDWLLENASLTVISREEDDRERLEKQREYMEKKYSARIHILSRSPLPMSSGEIRVWLRRRMGSDTLSRNVYAEIIRNRYYDASPELTWLREQVMPYLKPKRVAHVAGCESEAVLLAMHYGEDPEIAAEAGILHDITKKLSYDEQLNLCEKYGIVCDKTELGNVKLLHAKTGAALARDVFGVSQEVYDAICWHTTGKPDMTRLEKIVYLADYIEPTRDFPGVEKLRALAYKDMDEAMALGLKMSLEEIREKGVEPHKDTVEAYLWYK